jgi:hypothetical protein
MLGQALRRVRIVATEVEEVERLISDYQLLLTLGNYSASRVPIGDVVTSSRKIRTAEKIPGTKSIQR